MTETGEVEVFKTANEKIKKLVESRLVAERVSYLERWEKVPLFKRKNYDGAKEVCVILCDKYQKEEAIRIIEEITQQEHTA